MFLKWLRSNLKRCSCDFGISHYEEDPNWRQIQLVDPETNSIKIG